MTHANQIKFVHYLVKHETVLPSQKDDCNPNLADIGNHHFSFRMKDKRENIITKPQGSIFFEAVKPLKLKIKNQSRKILKQYYSNLHF